MLIGKACRTHARQADAKARVKMYVAVEQQDDVQKRVNMLQWHLLLAKLARAACKLAPQKALPWLILVLSWQGTSMRPGGAVRALNSA